MILRNCSGVQSELPTNMLVAYALRPSITSVTLRKKQEMESVPFLTAQYTVKTLSTTRGALLDEVAPTTGGKCKYKKAYHLP